MEDKFAVFIEGALKASGAGALIAAGIIAAVKWFLKDYVSKGAALRELEKKMVTDAIAEVKKLVSDVQLEVKFLADRIYHNERVHVEGLTKLNEANVKFQNAVRAIEGFVKNVNERFAKNEADTSEVIRIGKEIALIRAKKKAQNGGGT